MIGKIELGMKIRCLNCGKPIEIASGTFKLHADGEYVHCPECDYMVDVHAYHMYGEVVKEEKDA